MFWNIVWAAWVAAFVVFETIALIRRKRGDTFSEKVWWIGNIRVRKTTARTWAARTALIIAGGWLTMHLAFGWWTL